MEECLPREVAEDWCQWCEERLKSLPPDHPRPVGINSEIPALISVDATKLSPKAWHAACDLLGGKARITGETWRWTDAFIVNLPTELDLPWSAPTATSGLWHLDSHWFRCFLDSPEWALLAIVVWRDIDARGGATIACPETLSDITKWFLHHPEGSGQSSNGEPDFSRYLKPHYQYVELTARAGDVFFLSRNLLHAQSPNHRAVLRVITRASLSLKEPLCFNRSDSRYSPVELSVLHALKMQSLDFVPTRPRTRLPRTRDLRDYDQRRLELVDAYRSKGFHGTSQD